MTALPSNVCSTNEDKSKRIIVNKPLLQKCSTEEDELCSTEEGKLECTITKQKNAKNEVTYDVLNYFNAFNIFEWGRNILNRLDMTYEWSCMVTQKKEYYTDLLENMNKRNYFSNTPLSKNKLWQSINMIVAETRWRK